MKPAAMFRLSSKAFTLIELLVVVSILVLLIAILIPVVSKSRNSARAAGTLAQMQHIQQACEQYYNDFNAYPGPVADAALDGTVKFTAAQNLFLGLTRRFFPAAPPGTYTATKPDAALALWIDQNPGDQLASYATVGSGGTTPNVVVAGEPNASTFDAFIIPKPAEISGGSQTAQSNGLDLTKYPAFVDSAFGGDARPILYYRQAYKWDAENVAQGAAKLAGTPFASQMVADKPADAQACYYANNNTLIDKDGTIPTMTAAAPLTPLANFVTKTIGGTQVPGGGFVLISAGVDRIYGTSDDIVVFGGH